MRLHTYTDICYTSRVLLYSLQHERNITLLALSRVRKQLTISRGIVVVLGISWLVERANTFKLLVIQLLLLVSIRLPFILFHPFQLGKY